jgi:hypothetical protein
MMSVSKEGNEMKKIISVMLGLLVMAFATVCFAAES